MGRPRVSVHTGIPLNNIPDFLMYNLEYRYIRKTALTGGGILTPFKPVRINGIKYSYTVGNPREAGVNNIDTLHSIDLYQVYSWGSRINHINYGEIFYKN